MSLQAASRAQNLHDVEQCLEAWVVRSQGRSFESRRALCTSRLLYFSVQDRPVDPCVDVEDDSRMPHEIADLQHDIPAVASVTAASFKVYEEHLRWWIPGYRAKPQRCFSAICELLRISITVK